VYEKILFFQADFFEKNMKKLYSVNVLLSVSMVKRYQGPSGGHGLSAVCGRISELSNFGEFFSWGP
jgi:hypothetical protein